MLSREFFGLELVQELVHLVRIDPWPETIDKRADLKSWRRLYDFLGHPKADSQSLIDRDLETLPTFPNGSLKPLGDIWIESDRHTHESIMMLSPMDVQTITSLGAGLAVGRGLDPPCNTRTTSNRTGVSPQPVGSPYPYTRHRDQS
jgi:hypothetical protein